MTLKKLTRPTLIAICLRNHKELVETVNGVFEQLTMRKLLALDERCEVLLDRFALAFVKVRLHELLADLLRSQLVDFGE